MATANKPLFKNLYFKRKVADSQARACFICCKPTTAVLVTENGSVSFYYYYYSVCILTTLQAWIVFLY